MVNGTSRWALSICAQETAWKTFGANVRRERVARGLTQEGLAELCQLNVRTVAKIEAGELRLRETTVARLQEAIACPLARLIETSTRPAPAEEDSCDLKTVLARLSSERVTGSLW